MTREKVKEMLPILQAYAEGSVIECRTKPSTLKDMDVMNNWTEIKEIEFWNNIEYRIKESSYRPFKNIEECWNEMQKHKPFGWVKEKHSDSYSLITEVNRLSIKVTDYVKYYTFADGTPFGIKE